MAERNQSVEVVLAELEKYEITGRVDYTSKHPKVAWEYNGRHRFVVVSATPSDRRGWLNVRATVRRELRAMGVERPAAKVYTLARALSLPKLEETGPARLAELELNFEALLDLFVDVQSQLALTRTELSLLETRLGQARVVLGPIVQEEQAATPQQPKAASPSVGARLGRDNPSQKLLAAFEQLIQQNGREWQSTQDLSRVSGVPSDRMGRTLNYLSKDKGLVENGQRGWWRRVSDPVMVFTAAVSKP